MEPSIDRETYRKIKKMSREELQTFLINYSDTVLEKDEDTKTLDLPALQEELRQVKGIGEKRLEEIMEIIEKHLGI